jgi:hypothetical protein
MDHTRNIINLQGQYKLNFINDHFPSLSWNSLEDTKWCYHCDKQTKAGDIVIYEQYGQLWLECGNPGCDGKPIDWYDDKWWNRDSVGSSY